MEIVEQVLREDAADAGSDPWNSTLAYAYDDTVFHGYLYAVPDGMGIELTKTALPVGRRETHLPRAM